MLQSFTYQGREQKKGGGLRYSGGSTVETWERKGKEGMSMRGGMKGGKIGGLAKGGFFEDTGIGTDDVTGGGNGSHRGQCFSR